MPLYHFHVASGRRLTDGDGFELPNDKAAHLEAIRFAGEMLRDQPDVLWDTGQWRVEVCDEQNALLFTVIVLGVDAPERQLMGAPAPGVRPAGGRR